MTGSSINFLMDGDTLSSKVECIGDCREYHKAWPWLRKLGIISGANPVQAYCKRPEQTEFANAKSIMIAGCADEGLLESVSGALGPRVREVKITVVDLCQTPLSRCNNAAKERGWDVSTVRSDLLALEVSGLFDLVVGHSILSFLAVDDRLAFFKNVAARLKPGGTMYLFQAVRDGEDGSEVRFDAAEGQLFKNRALSVFRQSELALEEDVFAEMIDSFVATRRGVLVSDLDHVLHCATYAGLKPDRVESYQDGSRSANFVANRRTMVLHLRKDRL
jgi:SAM-dependent methyltransferase